jgi:hypothetical protein
LDEVGPLLRQIVQREDGGNRADGHASSAVDALRRVDIQQLFRGEIGIVFLGMNAIDGAGVHASQAPE